MSPPPAEPKHCSTCKWWVVDAGEPTIGQCHRYAPMPQVVGCAYYNHPEGVPCYPRTVQTEWCGDWVKA